jgi:dTDP-glucose 4,6-dehydratase/UDP-glucuronate decarboxylase
MKTAQDIVKTDLAYMAERLSSEFGEMAGKRLLIIGGAGFLGYYLVQAALYYNDVSGKPPIQLTVFDNYMRGMPDWLKALEGRKDLTLRKHDVIDALPADLPPQDYLIHAASIASPIFYRQFPLETMDANVNGLRLLLEYARDLAVKGKPMSGFLFYSTSEIYGDPTPDNIPTPETYRGNVSCTGPRACYDESKRYGETLCVAFAQVHKVPVKMARPFNNYGPGLKITDGRVLPDFARDIFAGRDIVMLSDGAPTRTFCYIADAIVGYYKILVRGRPGEAYNIGTETPEISMAELARRVTAIAAEEFGYKGKVVLGKSDDAEYLTDNPNRRCPIITKARTELGYEPSIGPDEGLKRSLLWYAGNQVAELA